MGKDLLTERKWNELIALAKDNKIDSGEEVVLPEVHNKLDFVAEDDIPDFSSRD